MLGQLRLQELLDILRPKILGNDLPEQGGITGNMGRSPYNPSGPINSQDIMTAASMSPETQQMPSNEAEEQLRAMLGQMPQRTQPGIGRRIMAGMVGMGAMSDPRYLDAAERVNYPGYYRGLEDQEAKLKPLKELADAEARKNTDIRLTESSERQADTAQKRLESTERVNAAKLAAAAEDRKIKQQQANTNQYRAENPGSKFIEDEDGLIYAVNPVTQKVTPLMDAEGEQIKTINLTPAQKKQMEITKQANAMSLEREKQKGRVELQEKKAGLTEKLEQMKTAGRIQVKQTPTGNSIAAGAKGLQPSQQRIDRINAVMQIISEYPELDSYYDIDDDGNIKVVEGDDPALRQIAVNKLFDARKADVKIETKPTATSGLKKAADIPAKDRVEGVTKGILGDGSVGVWGGNGWVKQ